MLLGVCLNQPDSLQRPLLSAEAAHYQTQDAHVFRILVERFSQRRPSGIVISGLKILLLELEICVLKKQLGRSERRQAAIHIFASFSGPVEGDQGPVPLDDDR